MMTEDITKLSLGKDLGYDEMHVAMSKILDGRIPPQETARFLENLREKGESDQELLAMLDSMQERSLKISPRCEGRVIDVCGTGGDRMRTFNISTAAAFVVAASGGIIAKHGNRSTSGISGSADIFEYFGYDLNMEAKKIEELIQRFRIGFMFAQKFHPAMKNVAEARKILGGRTAFNLVGPLSNPANVKNQLVGVFAPDYLERVVNLLKARGSENVMSVISEDGLDELSTTSKNKICQLMDGKISSQVLDPSELGLEKSRLEDLQVSTRAQAMTAFVSVLDNTGKKATIDVTALNAAAGLVIGGVSETLKEGLELAFETLDSGKAFDHFKNFIKTCGNIAKLEEVLEN